MALLSKKWRRVCVNGPPGTGKTLMLVLKGLSWLLQGHTVHVVSTDPASRAITIAIRHQLEKTAAAKSKDPSRLPPVCARFYDFVANPDDMAKALDELSTASKESGSLHVLMDDVDFRSRDHDGRSTQTLVKRLTSRCRGLHLWVSVLWKQGIPRQLKTQTVLLPLRSCPLVVREVEAGLSRYQNVERYVVRDTGSHPLPADGVSVERVRHYCEGEEEEEEEGRREGEGHVGQWPVECDQCGRDVGQVLRRLGVGVTGSNVRYSDVYVLTRSSELRDDADSDGTSQATRGFVRGLRDAMFPVKVVGDVTGKSRGHQEMEDLALRHNDVIVATAPYYVTGTERKVVVWLQGRHVTRDKGKSAESIEANDRLHAVSRCTTQLVVVDRN